MKFGKNISITIVCLILGLTVAWQYQSIRNNEKTAVLEKSGKDKLVTMLLNEKENNENLRKKNLELQDKVEKYENSLGNRDENMKLLNDEIKKLRIIAGLSAVKGKGVLITIGKDEIPFVTDKVLLDILNELRATSAQAISINDERIIATSEVRDAGDYIVVNGKQLIGPYVIRAIADPDSVERAFQMLSGIQERLFLDNITIKVEKSNDLTIPKIGEEVIRTDMMTPVENK